MNNLSNPVKVVAKPNVVSATSPAVEWSALAVTGTETRLLASI